MLCQTFIDLPLYLYWLYFIFFFIKFKKMFSIIIKKNTDVRYYFFFFGLILLSNIEITTFVKSHQSVWTIIYSQVVYLQNSLHRTTSKLRRSTVKVSIQCITVIFRINRVSRYYLGLASNFCHSVLPKQRKPSVNICPTPRVQ